MKGYFKLLVGNDPKIDAYIERKNTAVDVLKDSKNKEMLKFQDTLIESKAKSIKEYDMLNRKLMQTTAYKYAASVGAFNK